MNLVLTATYLWKKPWGLQWNVLIPIQWHLKEGLYWLGNTQADISIPTLCALSTNSLSNMY